MPIYEFRCLHCGRLFEKLFINPSEKADIRCPRCQSDTCERVISRVNYVSRAGAGRTKPSVTTRSCAPGSSCTTIEIPGADD
ncbi:zinc ribbon domain-containing protein [Desulfofundulus thermobenzoicus]|uniref:Zinc ribbon domain-containing protein n=1 Tax=Desulfofundulus thermobenzoicus TaxID=29376 RepID=A0A6N7IU93_9FIRM|nr:zinc ribbon domain-containing protein [Desulfofundulus thermobenzoicus]MQL52668.1 zinc ribbon domain-containing protein [Desulfofundulus thermobenzoicus]HHW44249.1 zinc ribbon domain-containing protein [Desulfotomaculum sp.]